MFLLTLTWLLTAFGKESREKWESLILSYDTIPLDLNFTYARAQKATARNIHGNALE